MLVHCELPNSRAFARMQLHTRSCLGILVFLKIHVEGYQINVRKDELKTIFYLLYSNLILFDLIVSIVISNLTIFIYQYNLHIKLFAKFANGNTNKVFYKFK